MRLAVRHVTRYAYDPAALRAALRLRLWPSRHDAQIVRDWTVSVNGEPVAPLMTDAWGEPVALWHAHDPVEAVEIVAEGVVETADSAGVIAGLDRCRATGVYLRATPLTEPDEA
ncbi:MAG: transglutaminase N-terminal domain-containing protein, partial [Pseudomonadota bacterium]